MDSNPKPHAGGWVIAAFVAGALLLALAAGWMFGYVDITYDVYVDNDPLKAPVEVKEVRDDGTLLLVDGRRIAVVGDEWSQQPPEAWKQYIEGRLLDSTDLTRARQRLVDVEPTGRVRPDGAQEAAVFTRLNPHGGGLPVPTSMTLPGAPTVRHLIRLPLVKHAIPRNLLVLLPAPNRSLMGIKKREEPP